MSEKLHVLWYITTRLVYLLTIVLPQRKHPFWLVSRILSKADSQVLFRTPRVWDSLFTRSLKLRETGCETIFVLQFQLSVEQKKLELLGFFKLVK